MASLTDIGCVLTLISEDILCANVASLTQWKGGAYIRFAATSSVVGRRLWGGEGERPRLGAALTREATSAALSAVCSLVKLKRFNGLFARRHNLDVLAASLCLDTLDQGGQLTERNVFDPATRVLGASDAAAAAQKLMACGPPPGVREGLSLVLSRLASEDLAAVLDVFIVRLGGDMLSPGAGRVAAVLAKEVRS